MAKWIVSAEQGNELIYEVDGERFLCGKVLKSTKDADLLAWIVKRPGRRPERGEILVLANGQIVTLDAMA